MIIYDVPAIVAAGFSPVVPVVVMDEREPANIVVGDGRRCGCRNRFCAPLFTANK